jgi:hypothetical protein
VSRRRAADGSRPRRNYVLDLVCHVLLCPVVCAAATSGSGGDQTSNVCTLRVTFGVTTSLIGFEFRFAIIEGSSASL